MIRKITFIVFGFLFFAVNSNAMETKQANTWCDKFTMIKLPSEQTFRDFICQNNLQAFDEDAHFTPFFNGKEMTVMNFAYVLFGVMNWFKSQRLKTDGAKDIERVNNLVFNFIKHEVFKDDEVLFRTFMSLGKKTLVKL